ncbi:frataxin [Chloropicon primus]|uniref:ferroxidase n=1 Tax=Chloropicon primus TaxID=1764295 RepID=A0A5B8MMQ3_9CHLO|nr:frataxin [Chloropicon primus]UPR01056.1 frataxin [Chloropicon primus]|eukprot:QDZ21836.1 frataxin [Chloropicon primus]
MRGGGLLTATGALPSLAKDPSSKEMKAFAFGGETRSSSGVASGVGLARVGATRIPAPSFATGAPGESGKAPVDFNRIADGTLDSLQDQLEELLEAEEVESSDVTYESGVLELDLGDLGTYVINKQAPNKQIWLSSPVSGPFRYDYSTEEGSWVYSRDNHKMHDKLSDELSELLGRAITIL